MADDTMRAATTKTQRACPLTGSEANLGDASAGVERERLLQHGFATEGGVLERLVWRDSKRRSVWTSSPGWHQEAKERSRTHTLSKRAPCSQIRKRGLEREVESNRKREPGLACHCHTQESGRCSSLLKRQHVVVPPQSASRPIT